MTDHPNVKLSKRMDIPLFGKKMHQGRSAKKLINFCIYCGSLDDLSDEHTVPYALGGRQILVKGSCKTCAELTSKLETHVCRDMFGFTRRSLNMPSRKQKKKNGAWQGKIDVTTFHKRNGKPKKIQADLYEAAGLMPFPYRPYPPRILSRVNFPLDTDHAKLKLISLDADCPKLPKGFHGTYGPEGKFHLPTFERVLIKIAYCQLFLQFNVAQPKPDLARYIFDEDMARTYILGARFTDKITKGKKDHYIYWERQSAPMLGKNRKFLIANIRLFSSYDTPEYRVVLGVDDAETLDAAFAAPKTHAEGL